MQAKNPEITFLIPCLNEEATIGLVIRRCRALIEQLSLQAEILVSDNGSNDQSAAIAQDAGARISHCPLRGYGAALRHGIAHARGQYIIMGDADDSYRFDEAEPFIAALRANADLVIGSRLKGSIEKGAMPALHRYLGTPVLTQILNTFYGTRISDCNCGLRGFNTKKINAVSFFSTGMEFASEMLIQAGINRWRITELPIAYYRDGRKNRAHLRRWRDGWRHLRLIMLYSAKHAFILPGFFLLVVGAAILIPLLFRTITIAGHTLEIHFAILGGLLMISGISTITMGIAAEIFSHVRGFHITALGSRIAAVFTLERGIMVGGALLLAGLTLDTWILFEWINVQFGSLDKGVHAIAASVLIVGGIHVFFASFLINLLMVGSKTYE